MASQGDLDLCYLTIAEAHAKLSYAKRLQVGAAILTENGGLYCGFNGTLPGFPNVCEIDEHTTDESITIHAEQNCLYKMLKEGVSAKGATIYLTHSPCQQCCKMLISSGIKRVVYKTEYRHTGSIEILRKANVVVEKMEQYNYDTL
tara:strand:+ start:1256 stop:1693 length:438 start_codon:yes stop_codon:yes gene_type:complete